MNKENQDHLQDDEIQWDKGEATYGHKRPEIKRKDAPNEHIENDGEDINGQLKNTNLSQEEDIANRNTTGDKGVGGKTA